MKRRPIPDPSAEEKKAFLIGLKKLNPKAAVVTTCFFLHHQPDPLPLRTLPRTISSLYHPSFSEMSHGDLLAECNQIFRSKFRVTSDEAEYLAYSTHLQSQSLLWFEHRKGRLTSSQFGPISRTSLAKPSRSLVSRILQQNPPPMSPAIKWGRDNEGTARAEYKKFAMERHTSFAVEITGLHVNPTYPHLGASPDGLISCSCCGDGLLEIKCPYSVRHTTPCSAPYWITTETGCELLRTHDYYYQVQGQLGILERSFCDFVSWTPHGLQVERIAYDATFFSQLCLKLERFFVEVILPRVLRGEEKENIPHPCELRGVYCFCQRGEYGDMVKCDSQTCKRGWFHFSCVNLTSPPDGAWFCPDCTCLRR